MKLLYLLFLGLSSCATNFLSNNEDIWIVRGHETYYCVANKALQANAKPKCFEAAILNIYDNSPFLTPKN